MALALYAGTFDPVTNGHLDVLARALALFDRVEVTVAANDAKTTLLPAARRAALLRACLADVPGGARAEVTFFEGLLVDRARARGAAALVRGLRQPADFDYEQRMALANRRLAPEVQTVFFLAHEAHVGTSSSIVREIWRWGGDVRSFVPPVVAEALAGLAREPRDA